MHDGAAEDAPAAQMRNIHKGLHDRRGATDFVAGHRAHAGVYQQEIEFILDRIGFSQAARLQVWRQVGNGGEGKALIEKLYGGFLRT